MDANMLKDWVIILSLIIAAGYLFQRIKLPPMLGFLLPGILLGPHGLALVNSAHLVNSLSELGVILLLFTIGIEFSVRHLLSIKRLVMFGGGMQVALTTAVFYGISVIAGLPWRQALFLGFIISLSSTAIVMKILVDREEVDSPQGKLSLGILIFQDLAVVPFMLLIPFLGTSQGTSISLGMVLGKAFLILLLLFVFGQYLVPRILGAIVRTRSQELFLFTIILLCLATVWATSQAGLSFALGAFAAGLIISQSEYSHHALALLLPFRDALISFFFVSIGMLLDLHYIFSSPIIIIGFAAAIIIVKSCLSAGVATILGYSSRIAVLSGIGLAQIGEFSFILSIEGARHGLLDTSLQQLFIAGAVITMALTPLLVGTGGKLSIILNANGLFHSLDKGRIKAKELHKESLENHVIIAGFGVNGQNIAQVLRQKEIPYIVLETDPEIVKEKKAEGEPIFFGDASQRKMLLLAGIKKARTLVVGVSAPIACRYIVRVASRVNPSLHIIVRTRSLKDREELLRMGAHEVVSAEFETSLEILARVLRSYFIPSADIHQLIEEVREGTYRMLRGPISDNLKPQWQTYLSELEIEPMKVMPGSRADRRMIGELALRTEHGVTLLVVRRGADIYSNPKAEFELQMNDIVVLVGKKEEIAEAAAIFS